jgi:hypothetical protein
MQIPEPPPDPDYYPVDWKQVGDRYCLDEKDAKNHLKNKALLEGHDSDLKKLLEGLKDPKAGDR